MQQVDILAIGVHPDDVELSCSGTLLRHLAAGHSVGLLDLTRGELGTRGSAEVRDREAKTSAEMMGAAFRINLGLADGFFEQNEASTRAIIRVIRACRPRIVLANALSDRHPDHGRAAKLTADACFYSGLVKIQTHDDEGQLQDRWRPQAVYHYIQDHNLQPDFVFDVSDFIEQKMKLILAFGSQFYNPEDPNFKQELESPISGKDFLDFVRAKNAAMGRPAGFAFAEGFNVSRSPGIRDLFALT